VPGAGTSARAAVVTGDGAVAGVGRSHTAHTSVAAAARPTSGPIQRSGDGLLMGTTAAGTGSVRAKIAAIS
jgi:hypothetical protein